METEIHGGRYIWITELQVEGQLKQPVQYTVSVPWLVIQLYNPNLPYLPIQIHQISQIDSAIKTTTKQHRNYTNKIHKN